MNIADVFRTLADQIDSGEIQGSLSIHYGHAEYLGDNGMMERIPSGVSVLAFVRSDLGNSEGIGRILNSQIERILGR